MVRQVDEHKWVGTANTQWRLHESFSDIPVNWIYSHAVGYLGDKELNAIRRSMLFLKIITQQKIPYILISPVFQFHRRNIGTRYFCASNWVYVLILRAVALDTYFLAYIKRIQWQDC